MCSKKIGFRAYSLGNQFEPLNLTPSKISDSLKIPVEEGGRMLICTNYNIKKGLKLIKKMTKKRNKRKITKTKIKNGMELNWHKI